MRNKRYGRDKIKLSAEELEKSKLETDKKILKKWAASTVRKQRLKAAHNPNTPMASLKRLQGYPEEEQEIMDIAKENPQMYPTEDGTIWANAESRVKKSRIKAAKNPNAPIHVINMLLNDSESEVAVHAAGSKLIDDSSFDAIEAASGVHGQTYRKFFHNSKFKKEWVTRWIDLMEVVGSPTLEVLEDDRFFSNDTEWLELFEKVSNTQPKHLTASSIATFCYNFVAYPKQNYSSEILVNLFTTYGKIINAYSPGTFAQILDTKMDTPDVREVMYNITNNNDYLSQEAKDIFLF